MPSERVQRRIDSLLDFYSIYRETTLIETNKALFRRYVEEVLNSGDYDRVEEFVAADWRYNGIQVGAVGYRRNHMNIRAAFPDFHISIERLIGEGDTIAADVTWSGSHTGKYRGIDATGKKVSWRSIQFRRYEDGLGVEGWGVQDNLTLLRQLGVSSDQFESG